MAWPVVIAENGRGVPVTESDNGVPVEIAENGYGTPVVLVEKGGIPVKGAGGGPVIVAPAAITDWDVTDAEIGGALIISIASLPDMGGGTLLDVEYRLDGGSALSTGITSVPDDFWALGLTDDQEYDVEVRAVNEAGEGAWSSVKAATPTDEGTVLATFDSTSITFDSTAHTFDEAA